MAEAQLNAISLAQSVRQRIVDFSASDLFVRDPDLTANLRSAWSGESKAGGLLSDLWVEGAFPPEASRDSLNSLEAEGILTRAFKEVLLRNRVFPSDQPLYQHQAESFRAAHEGYGRKNKPAIAVTAGTGAGKTESFLFPLLNDLFLHTPSVGEGVSAIILYPMNALVNDQVDRLYHWLRGQTAVTLFHFTSETAESVQLANRSGVPKWDPCRFRSRQQARGEEDSSGRKIEAGRGAIPRVLVTNYSMLEYMLCRPQDSVFFGRNLRSLVLDEAHLYTGTLAAEITLLQRRLLMRCKLTSADVVQYATSATIESKSLHDFIPKLFSKPGADFVLVEGRARRTVLGAKSAPLRPVDAETLKSLAWPETGVMLMDKEGNSGLRKAAPSELDCWCRCLSALTASERVEEHRQQCDGFPSRLVRDALSESPIVHHLESVLWERRRLSLGQLSKTLWSSDDDVAQEATRRLLQLCASARTTEREYPLLPNRVHFLVRSVQGVTVFFDDKPRRRCIAWRTRRFTLLPEHKDRCPETGVFGLSLARCQQCGEVFFQGAESDSHVRALPPHRTPASGETLRTYCLPDPAGKHHGPHVCFVPDTGKLTGCGEENGVELVEVDDNECPACGAKVSEEVRPFASSYSLQRAILAETILANVPEKSGDDRGWLPARGRRLLVFSDSRSAAARLGPSLTRQHAIQVVRAGIVRNFPDEEPELIEYLRGKIAEAKRKLITASSPLLRSQLLTEIQRAEAALAQHELGGSVSDWANTLRLTGALGELLDPETAQVHRADAWSQQRWEEHVKSMGARASLWIGRELARRPSWPNVSLETLGLVEVVYPGLQKLAAPDSLIGLLPATVAERLRAAWPHLVASLLDSLRTDGAVTLGSDEWDAEYSDADYQVVGKWASCEEAFGSGLIALAGKTSDHRRNAFVRRVLREFSTNPIEWTPDDAAVRDLLRVLFDQLIEKSADQQGGWPWLKSAEREYESGQVAAVRIDFSGLALRRPATLFRCEKTGQVWPRAVAGDAPATVALSLREIAVKELDSDLRIGRMRQELQTSVVFSCGLWGEEHSAQLSPQENRRLQELFKAGIRNVLSSTTTLELGIDIGGLHAVLMANLPPGKANYLQRAGRAGRRSDGSAAVIGFVRPYPYEQEVFHQFDSFLESELRRPTVFLDRERIVKRHWHAVALGEFFRKTRPADAHVGAMRAYGTMGAFCGFPKIPYWAAAVPKPDLPPVIPVRAEVRTACSGQAMDAHAGLDRYFLSFLRAEARGPALREWESILDVLRQGCPQNVLANSAATLLESAATEFEAAVARWKEDYALLLSAWKSLDAADPRNVRQANALYYQLNTLADVTVIETMADLQVLPRYGFPIGLSRLRVVAPSNGKAAGPVREEDQLRLERSGLMALREYVPGSRLMAGGRMVTSRGLLKHWTGGDIDNGFGLRGVIGRCANNHRCYSISKDIEACPLCSDPIVLPKQPMLIPKHGYTTAAWDPPRFKYDAEVVGHVNRQTLAFRENAGELLVRDKFGDVPNLTAQYRQDGEILVTNAGSDSKGFALCTKCGYADSEVSLGQQGRMELPSGFERHASLFSDKETHRCWPDEKAPVLRNHVLAARYSTDILLVDWSPWLNYSAANHREIHEALASALLLSGARLLDLDVRELGVMTDIPVGERGAGVGTVIYDNTPGGCGHVRELLNLGRNWLLKAYDLLRGDDIHHASCKHGCLNCILTFGPGGESSGSRPDRVAATEMLAALLGNKPFDAPPASAPNILVVAAGPASPGRATPVPMGAVATDAINKLRIAAAKADPDRKESIARLVQQLRSATISNDLYPLLVRVASDGLPLPRIAAPIGRGGSCADLLWETRNGVVVVCSGDGPPSSDMKVFRAFRAGDRDVLESVTDLLLQDAQE